jgi:hypothetical protein
VNVSDCPTPHKLVFASREAAVAKANVQNKEFHPYQCQCGSWHLTMRRTIAATVDPELVRAIADLGEKDFALLVDAELRLRATPEEAAALRTPENVERWAGQLSRFRFDVQGDMTRSKGRTDPEAVRRRAAQVKRLGVLHARRIEVKAIQRRVREEEARERARKKASDEPRRLAAAAFFAAKERLIRAHWDEHEKYLKEELEARGLAARPRTRPEDEA